VSYAQAKALDQKYHQSLTVTDTTQIDFNPAIQAEPDTLKDAF
jgi:urea carboxylase